MSKKIKKIQKKGVPKEFTIERGIKHNKEIYLPLTEVIKALQFHKGLKGDAIAKLFKKSIINK